MRQPETNIDNAVLFAIGAIVVSWFVMATLVVDFGLWQQRIRFYDLWVFIQDPGAQLSGINRSHTLASLGFGCVCALAVLAPLTPMFCKHRVAWLTYLIPFTVMAVSFAVLYTKTSAGALHANDSAHSVNAYLARIAHGATTRLSGAVATRISIGAGAYIAILAGCYLALRGLSRFRAATAGDELAAASASDD
jgi:hypothetical protein